MKALHIQLQFELTKVDYSSIKSVFVGGGTPSSVEFIHYEPILNTLKKYLKKDAEITFEANPNSASYEWLKGIKTLGANRVSFGVQSFDNEKLKFLGRNHNKEQAINAINNAKNLGFDHINMDLIYDTSLDTKELLSNDLKIIQTLPIDHISAYSLTIEEGTKFFKRPQVKVDNLELANYIFQNLQEYQFEQYEISNFAKNIDAQSKHNFGYWEKEDYLGVGAGAVGTYKNKRYYPISDVQKYINTPCEYEQIEDISYEDNLFEKIFLGLRSSVGVDYDLFNKTQQENIDTLIKEKKLIKKSEKIYNPNFLLTDEIVLFID